MKFLMKTLAITFLCAASLSLHSAGASAAEKSVPGLVPEDSRLMMVFANPGKGREAEFDAFYNQHMKDIAKLPNIVRVQKFKMMVRKERKPDPEYQYLFIWEFKGDQDETYASVEKWFAEGKITHSDRQVVVKSIGMYYAADDAGSLGALGKK